MERFTLLIGKPVPTDKEAVDHAVEPNSNNEAILLNLFKELIPKNSNRLEISPKVCTLNELSDAHIFNIEDIVDHIWRSGVDAKLKDNDPNIVDTLSKVHCYTKQGLNKVINFYSFMSKYCSYHKPAAYPIYDDKVDKILRYFRDVDNFADFKDSELKVYKSFKRIIDEFKDYYEFGKFYTYRQIYFCLIWLHDQIFS
jgi:hypothetical protein